ncbi:MAG: response regulator [Acidimicrobiales bacterium]
MGAEPEVEDREIRVLVVDDDPSVRRMVRIILTMEDDYHVVGEATDGEQAVAMAGELRPDVVLLDLEMPGTDGLASIPRIRELAPSARIAVLSSFPDPYTLADALHLGADTYLDKATSLSELPVLIRSLARQGPETAA